MNIGDVCKGRVAVVGNGPLSDDQRADINDSSLYDCIVRFNDRKNMREGEHTTVHAVRDVPGKDVRGWVKKRLDALPFFASLPPPRRVPGITGPEDDVYIQPVTARYKNVQRQFEGHAVLNPIVVREEGTALRARTYFPHCDACQTRFNCSSSSSTSGPSTGTAVIEALNASQFTSNLHVFGMNWMGGHHHFDFQQPDIVPTCCDKCIIYPPPRNTYI